MIHFAKRKDFFYKTRWLILQNEMTFSAKREDVIIKNSEVMPMRKNDDKTNLKQGVILRILHFYYDGFRTMTIGKTLWTIILIKLAIIFLVLKIFFFPNYIDEHAQKQDKAGFVSEEMLNR